MLRRLAALAVVLWGISGLIRTANSAEPAAGGKIRVLILSGANNHSWKTTTPLLKQQYEECGRFTVDVTEDVPALKGADFARYDVIVSNYTTWPNIQGHRWPAETEKAFLDYIAAGHGLVLIHAASTAWNDWPEFTDLIGLAWQKGKSGHGAYHSFAVSIADHQHPITQGMKDFQHAADELYHRQVRSAKAQVLATAFADKAMHGTGQHEPMIVVNEYGRGRIFHNAMGHDPKPMGGIGWKTLMLRGTEWAATGRVTIPIPGDWPELGGAAAQQLKKVEAPKKSPTPRRTMTLDGTWQIEQGDADHVPQGFKHTVAVPGLVDMSQPAFKDVGKKSPLCQAFWYRRTFSVDGPSPAIATLKIHKARYGTKVFLNGQVVGEHLPCFTPALIDVKPHLKGNGQPNELIIRVGADRESMPTDMPSGWDFEKYLYIPGIYDSVELILTGAPYVVNVQTVPDISAKTVRVLAEILATDKPCDAAVCAEVCEATSGKPVGSAKTGDLRLAAGKQTKIDLTIPIAGCRLWTPEEPFLYELKVGTGADAVKLRFGMRSFRFDAATGRAVLNGKPYFMRGSNVTIYRFFEDAQRGDRPWRSEWVRRLHQKYKTMHWTSLRYCIGFPPDFWYDIADEEGFLIQDEFPIWLLGKAPESPKAEKIIPEYVEWMRERWNHPCVVIWDGQNESNTEESGKAIQAVRHLDLSGRPWENGWAAPQSPTDCVESHPYFFIRLWANQKPFFLKELEHTAGTPHLNNAQKKLRVPVIINEYDWLWLNRDGTPTCLTDKVYESILGPNSTVAQRRMLHARYVAALTEFWRCHREAAGVLHFCGLGYSRAGDKPRPEGGATSDDFLDIEKLTFEPLFEEYVREAFNPVGLMLDFWAETVPAGATRPMKVYAINDLDKDWNGTVRLRTLQAGKCLSVESRTCKVPALGRTILDFTPVLPKQPGEYTIVAELTDAAGKPVRSMRDFKVK